MADNTKHPKRRLYGRKLSRPLTAERQDAIDSILPKLSFPTDIFEKETAVPPASYFSKSYKQYICEIGFGDGDHLAGLMKQHPDIGFIGAEPFINGMSAFLTQMKDEGLSSDQVRLWMDDGIKLLEKFEQNSLDGLYVLNPDPWPKVRHHKRRIINQEHLDLFAYLLKPGAPLIMTTDVDDLAEWMVTQASNHPDFAWTAKSSNDWTKPPPNWIETKYEAKGKSAGRKQTYLIFERN